MFNSKSIFIKKRDQNAKNLIIEGTGMLKLQFLFNFFNILKFGKN